MNEIINLISEHMVESIVILGISFVVLLLLFFINFIRFLMFKKKYNSLVRDLDGKNVEEILIANGKSLEEAIVKTDKLSEEIGRLETKLSLSIQNVGLIRYNAFGDLGPDLSFSIALLDEYLNGMVLTSIHGREQSTTYAKPVVKGKSEYSLSVEEMQAVEKAIKGEFYSNSI